ncbi:MAG: hypothetical protein FWF15_00855 [Oscillospiraceae bacterium]|nr:hypothetical protein [Oscillospiraceae bacterium]
MAKKVIALILTVIMITIMVVSCGGNSSGSGSGNNPTPSSNKPSTPKVSKLEKRATENDDLPDKNYSGKDFNVLTITDNLFAVNSNNGDLVNDSIYNRNKDVSERFNVKLNFMKIAAGDAFVNAVNESAAAGDNKYDLILGTQKDLIDSALNGSLIDIKTLSDINLTKNWWAQGANDTLAVNGKLYMAVGDLSISMWQDIFVVFFNDDIIGANSLKSPIDLVNGDAWNFDRFVELSLEGGRSFNGLVSSTINHPEQFIISLNAPVTKNGTDGFPTLDFNTDKAKKVAGRILDLYKGKNVIKNDAVSTIFPSEYPAEFTGGKALFMSGFLGDAVKLRNAMTQNFGIIPYPKYDEYQDKYYTTTLNSATMVAFTKSLGDKEMSGIITEALCAGGYKTVVIDYYELLLKKANGRDDASEDTLDTIRAGLKYNFGLSHTHLLGNIAELFENMANGTITDFTASYSENQDIYKNALASLVSQYKAVQ